MKITVGRVMLLYDILNEISDKKMQIATAYKINRNIKICFEELKNIDKSRTEIAEKYCIRDKNDKPVLDKKLYQFTDKDLPTVQEELNKLNEIELELPLVTIKLEELNNIELTPIEIESLMAIVEE